MDKPPYKLTIKLEAARIDVLHKALQYLSHQCDEHDQTGRLTTKVVIESFDEDDVLAIRDNLEAYIKVNRLVLDGAINLESPLVRVVRDPDRGSAPPRTPMEIYIEQQSEYVPTPE